MKWLQRGFEQAQSQLHAVGHLCEVVEIIMCHAAAAGVSLRRS